MSEDIIQEFKEDMKMIARRKEKSRLARKENVVLSLRKITNTDEWTVMLRVKLDIPGLSDSVRMKSFGDDYEEAEEYYEKLKDKHGFEERGEEDG